MEAANSTALSRYAAMAQDSSVFFGRAFSDTPRILHTNDLCYASASESTASGSSEMTSDMDSTTFGLRDRISRAAREERDRCLAVADAVHRTKGACCTSTQTDPVTIGPAGGACGTDAGGLGAATVAAVLPRSAAWTHKDDAAQAEAIQTLQMLGKRVSSESDSLGTELNLDQQRLSIAMLERELEEERRQKHSAQQQVRCLESELDEKKSLIQLTERALYRRSQDLSKVQTELRVFKEGFEANERARSQALQEQVLDLHRQLALKSRTF